MHLIIISENLFRNHNETIDESDETLELPIIGEVRGKKIIIQTKTSQENFQVAYFVIHDEWAKLYEQAQSLQQQLNLIQQAAEELRNNTSTS
jgi:hypothetical protein